MSPTIDFHIVYITHLRKAEPLSRLVSALMDSGGAINTQNSLTKYFGFSEVHLLSERWQGPLLPPSTICSTEADEYLGRQTFLSSNGTVT